MTALLCSAILVFNVRPVSPIRIAEHKRAVMNRDTNNALACHYIDTGHRILWFESRILEQEINWWKRRTKEAIYIKTTSNTINSDPGLIINPTWTSLFCSTRSL